MLFPCLVWLSRMLLVFQDACKPSDSVEAGTRIEFLHLSGNSSVLHQKFSIPREWTTQNTESVENICLSISLLITRHASIPGDCLTCIIRKEEPNRLKITIVFTPLTDEAREKLTVDANGFSRFCCMVCSFDCDDADETDSREKNCSRCYPCYLCVRCRIQMEDGRPSCYWCLDRSCLPYLQELLRTHIST